MPKEHRVGDLVRHRHRGQGESLPLEGKIGIVAAARSGDSMIFYPQMNQRYWLDNEVIQVLRDDEPCPDAFLETVHRILRTLDAVEFELEKIPPDPPQLDASVEQLSYRDLDRLRAELGDRLVDLTFHPEGMGRFIVRIHFRV